MASLSRAPASPKSDCGLRTRTPARTWKTCSPTPAMNTFAVIAGFHGPVTRIHNPRVRAHVRGRRHGALRGPRRGVLRAAPRPAPVTGYSTIDLQHSVADISDDELPDPGATDLDTDHIETDVRWLRHIYRRHGWPGAHCRKEEAPKAIKEYIEATPYKWIA